MFSGIHYKLTLYVQYIKNKAVKKWLPFEFICAVYLEYILTIDFIHPNQNLMIIYIQYTKTLSVKKWLPFELRYAVYLRVHTNHSLCLSIPKFTGLTCSVIYIMSSPYMFSTPRTKPSKSVFHLSLNVEYT